uniref:Uncharacterized protein n=1 Tax=Rhizophora mucronata TaxID=61149 RepID=A0A2P2NZF1_RHIMU
MPLFFHFPSFVVTVFCFSVLGWALCQPATFAYMLAFFLPSRFCNCQYG